MTGALPAPDDMMEIGGGADLSPWMGDSGLDPSTMQGALPPPSALSPETRKILMEQIQRLSAPREQKRSMWTDPAFLAGMTLLGRGNMGQAAMAAAQAQARHDQTNEIGETRRATALASLTGQLSRGDQMAAMMGAKTTAAQQKALAGALSLVAPTQRGVLYKAINEKQIDPTNLGAVYDFIGQNGLKLAPSLKAVAGVGLVDMSGEQPKVVVPVQHAPPAPSDTERLLVAAGFKPGTPEYQAEAKKMLAKKEGGGGDAPFAGTGMDAQTGNVLNRLGPKIADGTATPEEQRVYAYAYNHAAQPKPYTDPESGKTYFIPQTVPPHFPAPTMGAPAAPAVTGAPPSALGASPAASAPPAQPNGVRVVETMPPKPKEMTEGQANAALYADRMRASEKVISEMEAEGLDPVTRGVAKIPVVGNYMVSPRFQQLDQAKRDFINATLRRESGAVISPAEFENADKQYFPVPGDGPDVLEQKKQNRRIALEGISRAAGKSYQPTTGGKDFSKMSKGDLANVDTSALSAEEKKAWRAAAEKAMGQ